MTTITLKFISTGVKKHQTPNNPLPKADLYLDCRGIPNPHHAPGMSGRAGDDPALINWVRTKGNSHIETFINQIYEAIPQVPMRRRETDKPFDQPVVICCMCAYGVHRSVAVKHILAKLMGGRTFQAKSVLPEPCSFQTEVA